MLSDLDTVPWSSFPQPEWNAPDAIRRALRRLAEVVSESESRAAYNDYLSAIGNNHSGSYYPVVVPTLPFLGVVLERGGEWARWTALQVLIDLTTSFEPEPGYATMSGSDGAPVDLAGQFASEAARLSKQVRALAGDPTLLLSTREAAKELLLSLTPDAATPG